MADEVYAYGLSAGFTNVCQTRKDFVDLLEKMDSIRQEYQIVLPEAYQAMHKDK